jgi:Asp-tRNA(Asn)/Glu-tRNA(Gln) amidotransferase A subunit family amidase
MKGTTYWLAGALLASAGYLACAAPDPPGTIVLEEATIADIHAALRADQINCYELVARYLARITAYDKAGPAINALVVVNEAALARADELDRARQRGDPMGRLHCIPVIVKDNFDTIDLPTTAGSLSLEGFVPNRDAFQVRRIREAGGIVMAKSNMAEFAFSPYETVSSILPGYTRNPYSLARVTAGSSGGTAAAVSANFGAVGLGSDTGNSIRGPSAHQSLVGIRSTMGLTSRAGVVPLNLASDIAGPMTRSVADAAAVLEVVEGYDPDDPVTEASRQQTHRPYVEALDPERLEGARLGVLRWITNAETADSAVLALFESALGDLQASGATLIDPLEFPGLDILLESREGGCSQFKFDLNAYLASHGDHARVRSLEDVIQSDRFHPSIQRRLELGQAAELEPADNPACQARDRFRQQLRDLVLHTMDNEGVDALVYPTWNNRPRLIGDLNTPHGDNNQLLAPNTGFPAMTVPMGYIDGELPAGLQFFGRPWDEFTLIGLAYAYEQATHHRRPPASTPRLE